MYVWQNDIHNYIHVPDSFRRESNVHRSWKPVKTAGRFSNINRRMNCSPSAAIEKICSINVCSNVDCIQCKYIGTNIYTYVCMLSTYYYYYSLVRWFCELTGLNFHSRYLWRVFERFLTLLPPLSFHKHIHTLHTYIYIHLHIQHCSITFATASDSLCLSKRVNATAARSTLLTVPIHHCIQYRNICMYVCMCVYTIY